MWLIWILVAIVAGVLISGMVDYWYSPLLRPPQRNALAMVASAAGALAMLITILYIKKQIEAQGKALELQGKQMALQDEALGYSYRPGLWLQVTYDKNFRLRMGPSAINQPAPQPQKISGIPVSLRPITQATVFSVVVNSQSMETGFGKNMVDTITSAINEVAASLWNCESVAPDAKKWCLIGPWEELENSNTITVKWRRPVSGGWEPETQEWTLRVMSANPKTAEERRDCSWEIVPNPPEKQAALNE